MRRVVFVAAAVCVLMAAGCKGEGHSVHVLGPALRISLGAGNPAGRAVDASESGVEGTLPAQRIVAFLDAIQAYLGLIEVFLDHLCGVLVDEGAVRKECAIHPLFFCIRGYVPDIVP